MKWIVGLGNPGDQYAKTRHNVGFMLVDELSQKWGIPLVKEQHRALIGEGVIDGQKVLLVKPMTYMNLSGEAVGALYRWYKAPLDTLLVVYDDMDLPLGMLRLRLQGSAGGHNGMKSIIQHLGTSAFKRLRIGIGRPPAGTEVVQYVLQPFTDEEKVVVQEALAVAAEAVESWLTQPFEQVMSRYNRRPAGENMK